jgi:hypothetical protein
VQEDAQERVRRAYDPSDEEKAAAERSNYEQYQVQVAERERQRVAEEEERRRVVSADEGYRNYTHGVQPWMERANPFSGSEHYEAYLRREYLRGLMEDNQRAEAEKGAYRQYEREVGRAEDQYLLHGDKTFWNKDLDKDKWWYKQGERTI